MKRIQIEFVEHSISSRGVRKIEKVYETVKQWDYIPSTRLLQDVFGVSSSAASELRLRLFREKGITKLERLELRKHRPFRGFLGKFLRNVFGRMVFTANIENLPYPESMTNRKPLFKKKERQLKLTEIPVMTIELPEIPEEYDITKEVQI